MARITGNLTLNRVSREQLDQLRLVLKPLLEGGEETIRESEETGVVWSYQIALEWQGDDAALQAKIAAVTGMPMPEGVVLPVRLSVFRVDKGRKYEIASEKALAFLDMRLDDVIDDTRTRNCLLGDYDYFGELIEVSEAELLRYPNFGRKSLNELKELLAGYDLWLGGKLEGWQRPDVASRAKLNGVPVSTKLMSVLKNDYREGLVKTFPSSGWKCLGNVLSDAERMAKLEQVDEKDRKWLVTVMGYARLKLEDELVGFIP